MAGKGKIANKKSVAQDDQPVFTPGEGQSISVSVSNKPVTAEPETFMYEDLNNLDYIVLACDGLYDVLTNDNIEAICQDSLGLKCRENLDEKSEQLVSAAQMYMQGETEAGDALLDIQT